MTVYLPDIQFAKPELLWLLAALPVVWLRYFDRRPAVVLGRTVIAALLILAVADPQSVATQTTHQERLFAFDVSRSITPEMRRWMEQLARGELAPRKGDRVFLFGAETAQTNDWRDAFKGNAGADIAPEKTNLEKLLTTVMALPPRPRSLFLFSDGWETEGSAARLLPLLGGTWLKIYPMVPVASPHFANVAVTRLLAPTQGNSAEAIYLKAVVENFGDREVDGTLELRRNGQIFKTQRVKLKPGSQVFTYENTLPEEAVANYRATFVPTRPEFDEYAPDNHATTSVTVRTKAKVLLLSGRPGADRYLLEIIKREGFEVTSRTPDSAPAPTPFNLVIFNNVERDRFPSSYLTAVEKHVAAGNGFLMLGNEASFAPGSYQGTPIAAMVPLEPREPPKREEKNRAVVLIIDKSGSMREDNRILYAQEAAKAVARQLNDNDLLGVVGFDVSPFVVVPLSTVGSIRRVIDAQIERLRPGGRTYLLPAINEAKRQLQRQDATVKHVIILSDGETGGSGGDYIDLVHVMRTELKITVSAVAIGAEANLPLMKRITQYGGGFFHHTFDPSSLPRIVLRQIQESPRNEPRQERELIPVQEPRSEIFAGIPRRGYPRVVGYMETELKRGASLDLAIPSEGRRAPLLASWRYGRGKSAALAMDMESRFSRDWIQWNGLQPFWDRVLTWLRPVEEPIPLHEARVNQVNMRPILDLYVFDEGSANSQFTYTVSGKNGKHDASLKRLAPGHYQAELPISVPGDYQIQIAELRRDRRLSLSSISYSLPYDSHAELPRPSYNTSLLAQLAQASGGEINPRSQVVARDPLQADTLTPQRDPLIALAFLLFLLEVALRKFVFSEAD